MTSLYTLNTPRAHVTREWVNEWMNILSLPGQGCISSLAVCVCVCVCVPEEVE